MTLFGGQPFTRQQATNENLTLGGLRQLVSDGQLRRMLHGVYVDSAAVDSVQLRAAAVALVLPPGAVVCRTSAAWLHGIDTLIPGEHERVPGVECMVRAGGQAIRRPSVDGFSGPVCDDDLVLLNGIPVTTPLRTAVDLLRTLPRPHALAAADGFLHRGLIDQEHLLAELERFAGYRGVCQARELARLSEPGAESAGESWARLRIIDAGLPRPEVQLVVRDRHGRLIYRIDMGYGAIRKGFEYDGEAFHGRQHEAHDAYRRDRLRREFGWEIFVCRKGDVLGNYPGLELAVAEALGMEPRLPRRW